MTSAPTAFASCQDDLSLLSRAAPTFRSLAVFRMYGVSLVQLIATRPDLTTTKATAIHGMVSILSPFHHAFLFAFLCNMGAFIRCSSTKGTCHHPWVCCRAFLLIVGDCRNADPLMPTLVWPSLPASASAHLPTCLEHFQAFGECRDGHGVLAR